MKLSRPLPLLMGLALVSAVMAMPERLVWGQIPHFPGGGGGGAGKQVQGYINHGANMATGRESLAEGVKGIVGNTIGGERGRILEGAPIGFPPPQPRWLRPGNVRDIVGVSTGDIARGVLGRINRGDPALRPSGIADADSGSDSGSDSDSDSGSGSGSGSDISLNYGEQIHREWHIRDAQGNEETVEAKEWKLSYTAGEGKFTLVLMDGTEKEYPVEGLFYKDDLKYLCSYLLANLERNTDPQDDANTLSENVKTLTVRFDEAADEADKPDEKIDTFFGYLNGEFTSVSFGLMKIDDGTQAGEEKTLSICGEQWTFRWCPAGGFTRTTFAETTEYETSRDGYGRTVRRQVNKLVPGPEHRVELTRGFWILDSEITRQMYDRVMSTQVSDTLSDPQLPETGITWNDADNFCKQLKTITGHEFTLPTEAQWEYACRGGVSEENTADLDAAAWYQGNSGKRQTGNFFGIQYTGNSQYAAHDVKTKQPNAWGIYDMQGNVREWCLDWFGDYGDTDAADPQGPADGQYRVVRGGGCRSEAEKCRPGYRDRQEPAFKAEDIGFRVVLIPDAPDESGEPVSAETDGQNGAAAAESNANAETAADNTDSGK